jgi:CheY-like chemotaxis protein
LFSAISRALKTGSVGGEAPRLPAKPSVSVSEKPLKILLAEDNAVNRVLATRLLEKAGHSTVGVSDGAQAVSAYERERFDVILMDGQMPVMDGIQATAAIREKERTTGTHIPIVAVTAHALDGDRERFLAAGMDGYVPKPVRASELFAAIESAMQSGPETLGGAESGLGGVAPLEPAMASQSVSRQAGPESPGAGLPLAG